MRRSLFLNAQAAVQAAPKVAALMAAELGYSKQWEKEQVSSFRSIGGKYLAV